MISEKELIRLLQAQVELDQRKAFSDEHGRYLIRSLAPTIMRLIHNEVAEERRAKREVQR